jgi:hypothetical protein
VSLIILTVLLAGCNQLKPNRLTISCAETNDLYKTLVGNNINCLRFNTPMEAVEMAREGSGVMILADGYPEKTTTLDSSFFRIAVKKKLRLFIEYPAFLPGLAIGPPRHTQLERVVVTTKEISGLDHMRILALHGCVFTPVKADEPILAAGRVAGFDKAVFGLDSASIAGAILFRYPTTGWLISTTMLSQFITARYAPQSAIQALWGYILAYVEGEGEHPGLPGWIPEVRPSYSRDQELPAGAGRLAVQRGIDWHTKAGMLLGKEGWEEYKQLWNLNDSNMHTTVEAVDNAAPGPESEPGNGSYGVLEGIASEVNYDGSQPTRWWLRSDSNGESSLAFALRWKMDGDTLSRQVAENLLDWLYFSSGLFQTDPSRPNYGLLFWAPGNAQALYQDNDVKAILGCIGTSCLLNTDKWDEVLAMNILANFRTTGRKGFRGIRIENPDLLARGWRYYRDMDVFLPQPHYEAWTWASYLWLYDKTGWKPLLDKTSSAIRMMMEAYPSEWRWTNGIQQERGRMLLPLAWLIRIDDRPEYREWLRRIASDIERCQDESGAIREELGEPGRGDMAPPASNSAYGTGEAPLIQTNGDSAADLLYTCNFTFLGLNEAYAATGEDQYRRMAGKLADFLIRIQVKSEKHRELDGGWFRAFDYRQWEYWGSNADSGWGAWSIETGWTQAWIPSVLAMREMNLNLWDISRQSKVNAQFQRIRSTMIPDADLLALTDNHITVFCP